MFRQQKTNSSMRLRLMILDLPTDGVHVQIDSKFVANDVFKGTRAFWLSNAWRNGTASSTIHPCCTSNSYSVLHVWKRTLEHLFQKSKRLLCDPLSKGFVRWSDESWIPGRHGSYNMSNCPMEHYILYFGRRDERSRKAGNQFDGVWPACIIPGALHNRTAPLKFWKLVWKSYWVQAATSCLYT